MILDEKDPFVIAHRGGAALSEHENTLEAYQKAIDIGCRVIEFDVRRTKDLVMVSYHDETISEKLKIAECTYAEVLEFSKSRGFHVPTVEEILILSKAQVILDIELKEAGYEQELILLVKKYLDIDEYFMKSFEDNIIIQIKKIDPSIRTGLLLGVSSSKKMTYIRLTEIFPLVRILRARPDFISPHYKLLYWGFIKGIKFLRLPLLVWTVNDEQMIENLFEKGINGIITDRPDVGLKILERMRKSKQSKKMVN